MPQIEEGMRARIAEYLPRALECAVESYHRFADQESAAGTIDAGEFKKHHDACKVAIAHIQLLIKLAQWADIPDSVVDDAIKDEDMRTMIVNARGELSDWKGDRCDEH